MKKTIVKVLAIVFVVSILVSSMFIMTGAACNSGYEMEGSGGYDYVKITYNYVDGKIEANNITILNGADTYHKMWMADSDLKYSSSEKCFKKTAVAMTNAELIASDDSSPRYLATIRVHTGSKRAPKVGDTITILLHTDEGPQNISVCISSIKFLG